MDIKEQIHGLTEEMLANLGRLVAIDSQLGTPAEGMPFGEGPAKCIGRGTENCRRTWFQDRKSGQLLRLRRGWVRVKKS